MNLFFGNFRSAWIKFPALFLLFIFFLPAFAKEYKPEDIVNPNIADRRDYVADPGNILSQVAKNQINATLWNLRQTTGAEVVLAVIPDIGELPPEDFSTALFDNWKIGKSDKDNGLLILIVPEQRVARIATGYGLEGIIPDVSARKIINRSIIPYMKENDIDGAAVAVTKDVANILSNPEVAQELKSNQNEAWDQPQFESDLSVEDLWTFIFWVVILVAVVSYVKYFIDVRRFRNLDRYGMARGWQEERNLYTLMAVFSFGLGLIPLWLSRRKYHDARNKPMACPACKGKMRKLNEEEDNSLLSPSQDMEEKLDSVDYDVWVCEDCGTVEKYAFPNKHSQYQECPHCHTKAMTLVEEHTLVPPTSRRSGVGERIYECKYCHNQTRNRYTIPKKEDTAAMAAALAAGALMGSGRGRGGSGGGFGGGFGGGRTGGGGATGRW